MKKTFLILLISFNLLHCAQDQNDAFLSKLYHSINFIPEHLKDDVELKEYLLQEEPLNEESFEITNTQENKEDINPTEEELDKSTYDLQGFDPLDPRPKNFRTICKLCGHAPKKFKKHLFEVHFICGCAEQYSNFNQAKICQKSHKRIRKDPKLLEFVSHLKPIVEKTIFDFECSFCNKKTVTQTALNSHKFYMHYICYVCGVQHSNRDQAFECKNSH